MKSTAAFPPVTDKTCIAAPVNLTGLAEQANRPLQLVAVSGLELAGQCRHVQRGSEQKHS
ncbi:MAG TPA: hypothetical protein VKB88_15680 [Bryobacteraceae bacterium]|nr:hypothetical protein [Bryobacteraceae bacterium]